MWKVRESVFPIAPIVTGNVIYNTLFISLFHIIVIVVLLRAAYSTTKYRLIFRILSNINTRALSIIFLKL